MLARIYSETGRYGESLAAARTATRLQPNSEAARAAQDAASAPVGHVVVTMANCPEVGIVYNALWRAGASSAPCSCCCARIAP